ncbi:SET domain-containing protein [Aureococcus anophagefferens]|nr:SET domain-containing protein [Aureococcus anophagefferens]
MDNVCRECEVSCEGEATVACAGPCGATFHRDCVGETGASARWTCPSCALKVVRCALCGEFELEESADRCLTAGCARAACSRCAPADGAFDCGGHACGACGAALGRGASTVKCVRCPKAFCRGCRPGASVLITVEVMKCVSHRGGGAPGGSGGNCFRCGQPGHQARECPNGDRCFRCGMGGHQARDCPGPPAGGLRRPAAAGLRRAAGLRPRPAAGLRPGLRPRPGLRRRPAAPGGNCFRCGQPGHQARECPNGDKCFRCGMGGHQARDCPQAAAGGPGGPGFGGGGGNCYRCGMPGHMARDCPQPPKGGGGQFGGTCYRCGQPGHQARDCPAPARRRQFAARRRPAQPPWQPPYRPPEPAYERRARQAAPPQAPQAPPPPEPEDPGAAFRVLEMLEAQGLC